MVVLCDLVEIMYWVLVVKIMLELVDDLIILFDECVCGQVMVEKLFMCVMICMW